MDSGHLRSLDVAMDSAESPGGDLIYFLSRGSTIYSTPTAATADSLVAGLESAAALDVVRRSSRHMVFEQRPSGLRASLEDPLIDTPSLSVSPDRNWILYSQKGMWRSDLVIAAGSF